MFFGREDAFGCVQPLYDHTPPDLELTTIILPRGHVRDTDIGICIFDYLFFFFNPLWCTLSVLAIERCFIGGGKKREKDPIIEDLSRSDTCLSMERRGAHKGVPFVVFPTSLGYYRLSQVSGDKMKGIASFFFLNLICIDCLV